MSSHITLVPAFVWIVSAFCHLTVLCVGSGMVNSAAHALYDSVYLTSFKRGASSELLHKVGNLSDPLRFLPHPPWRAYTNTTHMRAVALTHHPYLALNENRVIFLLSSFRSIFSFKSFKALPSGLLHGNYMWLTKALASRYAYT